MVEREKSGLSCFFLWGVVDSAYKEAVPNLLLGTAFEVYFFEA